MPVEEYPPKYVRKIMKRQKMFADIFLITVIVIVTIATIIDLFF